MMPALLRSTNTILPAQLSGPSHCGELVEAIGQPVNRINKVKIRFMSDLENIPKAHQITPHPWRLHFGECNGSTNVSSWLIALPREAALPSVPERPKGSVRYHERERLD